MSEPITLPALPCPECRLRMLGEGKVPKGPNRIGNRRTYCNTCNAFAQNVTRIAGRKLREMFPEVYSDLRVQVERDLYPQVIEDFTERQGLRGRND